MSEMPSLMGVVLCGGNSSRMGRDKGLILKEGIPWARYMADKLLHFNIPVVFSINPGQTAAYAAALPGVRMVIDNVEVEGPLRGLLSVHTSFPGKDLLLLACDMPDLDLAAISQLVNVYRAGGDFDFYACREAGFFQPFCAVYTSAGLNDHRQDLSLQQLLREGKTKALPVLNSRAFKNYNTL